MNQDSTLKPIETFELRRRSDNLVYTFRRVLGSSDPQRFVRLDREDLFIQYDAALGWVALDPKTREVTGKPWNDALRHNPNQPPQGDWVSKKGARSYVYDLRYVSEDSGYRAQTAA